MSPYPALSQSSYVRRDGAVFVDLSPKTLDKRQSLELSAMTMYKTQGLTFDTPMLSDSRRGKLGNLATAALTKTEGNGRLRLHGKLTPFCATLWAVTAAPGLLLFRTIITQRGETMNKAIMEHALNTAWGIAELLEALKSEYAQQLKDAVIAIKSETLDSLPL